MPLERPLNRPFCDKQGIHDVILITNKCKATSGGVLSPSHWWFTTATM